jgi:hypothetical protein
MVGGVIFLHFCWVLCSTEFLIWWKSILFNFFGDSGVWTQPHTCYVAILSLHPFPPFFWVSCALGIGWAWLIWNWKSELFQNLTHFKYQHDTMSGKSHTWPIMMGCSQKQAGLESCLKWPIGCVYMK